MKRTVSHRLIPVLFQQFKAFDNITCKNTNKNSRNMICVVINYILVLLILKQLSFISFVSERVGFLELTLLFIFI